VPCPSCSLLSLPKYTGCFACRHMGRLFIEPLEGRVYCCGCCGAHLASVDELVSKVCYDPSQYAKSLSSYVTPACLRPRSSVAEQRYSCEVASGLSPVAFLFSLSSLKMGRQHGLPCHALPCPVLFRQQMVNVFKVGFCLAELPLSCRKSILVQCSGERRVRRKGTAINDNGTAHCS
jgi:hypothetical protein